MALTDEQQERIDAIPRRTERYVTAYLGEGELKMLAKMQEQLGSSRSATIRAAIHAYAAIVSKMVD
jgi:hypothetical protein